jgi:hypothetical protein
MVFSLVVILKIQEMTEHGDLVIGIFSSASHLLSERNSISSPLVITIPTVVNTELEHMKCRIQLQKLFLSVKLK